MLSALWLRCGVNFASLTPSCAACVFVVGFRDEYFEFPCKFHGPPQQLQFGNFDSQLGLHPQVVCWRGSFCLILLVDIVKCVQHNRAMAQS